VLDADQPDVSPDEGQPVRANLTPKKAGPTPKRSQAEAGRRGPYQAPTDRRSAGQNGKQQTRADRSRRAEALQRGEQWALPPKDRGPVRALARDLVDARRGISEYYLIAVVPIFVLIFLPNASLKVIADFLVLVILLIVTGEGYLVGRKVQRAAQERFPGQSTRGVKLYAAMRGTQLRRLRIPKPRVARGDSV
jgi:Protein of unknown function (DUF3043)